MLAKENCYKWICHSNKPPVHLLAAGGIKQFSFCKLTPDTQNLTRKPIHIPAAIYDRDFFSFHSLDSL